MDKKGKGKNKGKKENNKEDKKGGNKEQKLKTCNFVKARHILCSKQSQIEEIFNKLNEEYGMNPPASEFEKEDYFFNDLEKIVKNGIFNYTLRKNLQLNEDKNNYEQDIMDDYRKRTVLGKKKKVKFNLVKKMDINNNNQGPLLTENRLLTEGEKTASNISKELF